MVQKSGKFFSYAGGPFYPALQNICFNFINTKNCILLHCWAIFFSGSYPKTI